MYYALFDSNGNRITTYIIGVNCEAPPENSVEITEEEHLLYITNEYILGADGKPHKKPPYEPTLEERLAAIRTKRNQLLSECDWTRLDDNQLTAEQKQEWAIYRQQLRDFPETCDPYNPVWPIKP